MIKIFFSDFIENDLVTYAKENPGVVVYVKPRRHRGPVIKAEYCKKIFIWFFKYSFPFFTCL